IFVSGQITGLVGDNGAGKSTLLRLIAGLDLDYSGHIYYDGQPLTKPLYQQMTMVFQTPYLLKRSVYENIAYPLKLRHRPAVEIKEKTQAMIARLGIEKLAGQYAHRLSGGESQKVALARALIFEPDLVLLDEPMSGIDAASVSFMEQMIADYVQQHQKTVIMITHNARQAQELCHRVVHL
ncbi:MAG: ATP-binding cassette domain-containing protein, partial [Peptococcaceae bacterium]